MSTAHAISTPGLAPGGYVIQDRTTFHPPRARPRGHVIQDRTTFHPPRARARGYVHPLRCPASSRVNQIPWIGVAPVGWATWDHIELIRCTPTLCGAPGTRLGASTRRP